MRALHYLLLGLVLTCAFWAYGYLDILPMRPNSVHMWRQTDCTSQTINYYQNDMPFFTPQTHTQTGTNGHAASEFPIIYYTVGQLYNFFGPHECILRLVNLSLFIVGLYCLFAFAREYTESYAIAWLTVMLVATSTYLVYYANNFLVNVSALSLAFCGWRAFGLYIKSGRLVWLVLLAALFLLAALLKVDAGISFMAIAGILFLENVGIINITPNTQKQWLPRALLFLVVGALCFGWYAYAAWFNNANGTGQNLLGLFPIWEISLGEIMSILKLMGPAKWAPHFQSYPTLAITFGMFMYLLFRWRRLPALDLQILFWLTMGCGAYFLLWFRAFDHHDYYMVNLFIWPVFIWLLFLRYVKSHWQVKVFNAVVLALFGLSLYNVFHASKLMDERYYGKLKESAHPAIYAIEPYLRSIGIDRHDLVVSVPDVSPNITLYLMNNPGWTEAFNWSEYNINYFVGAGAKYLIVSDSSYLQLDLYKPYLTNHIGHYQGVEIYKLH